MPEVTIRDVAQEAGLSVSSVSRILRGGSGHVFAATTQERVREIAARLGYQPNVAARMLRQSTRSFIGLSAHLTEHPHLNSFLVATRAQVLESHYDPVVLDTTQIGQSSLRNAFPPLHMLGGIIHMATDLLNNCPPTLTALRQQVPQVAMQAVCAEAEAFMDVVRVDYHDAFQQGLKHLQELGHTRIIYLGPVDEPNPIDERKFSGWQSAARSCGVDPASIIPWRAVGPASTSPLDDSRSYQNIRNTVIAVAEIWRKMEPRPTGIICASDSVAICLQSCLLSWGFQLPRDVSIVGYDGILFGDFAFPALTTVAPNHEAMAKAAIECLLPRIHRAPDSPWAPPREVQVKPRMIMRGSTAPPLH